VLSESQSNEFKSTVLMLKMMETRLMEHTKTVVDAAKEDLSSQIAALHLSSNCGGNDSGDGTGGAGLRGLKSSGSNGSGKGGKGAGVMGSDVVVVVEEPTLVRASPCSRSDVRGRSGKADDDRFAHSSSTIETVAASGEVVSSVSPPISAEKLAEEAARKLDRRRQSTRKTVAANLHARDVQEAGKGNRLAVQDAGIKTRAPSREARGRERTERIAGKSTHDANGGGGGMQMKSRERSNRTKRSDSDVTQIQGAKGKSRERGSRAIDLMPFSGNQQRPISRTSSMQNVSSFIEPAQEDKYATTSPNELRQDSRFLTNAGKPQQKHKLFAFSNMSSINCTTSVQNQVLPCEHSVVSVSVRTSQMLFDVAKELGSPPGKHRFYTVHCMPCYNLATTSFPDISLHPLLIVLSALCDNAFGRTRLS